MIIYYVIKVHGRSDRVRPSLVKTPLKIYTYLRTILSIYYVPTIYLIPAAYLCVDMWSYTRV